MRIPHLQTQSWATLYFMLISRDCRSHRRKPRTKSLMICRQRCGSQPWHKGVSLVSSHSPEDWYRQTCPRNLLQFWLYFEDCTSITEPVMNLIWCAIGIPCTEFTFLLFLKHNAYYNFRMRQQIFLPHTWFLFQFIYMNPCFYFDRKYLFSVVHWSYIHF